MKKEKKKEADKDKENLRSKMLELLKETSMEERFTFSIREKKKRGLMEYPARTICGCDGEAYNTMMNWAYKHKITKSHAIEKLIEKSPKLFKDVKQRPKSADSAAMRYWKSRSKRKGTRSPSSKKTQ